VNTTRRLLGGALLLGAALSLAACGGTSSSKGGSTTSGSGSAAAARQDPQQAALDFARCMRQHGVDMPDPDFSNGGLGIRLGGPGMDPNDPTFRAAMKSCGSPFGKGGPTTLSPEKRADIQQAALDFARCMRRHGVDMPDPSLSGGGVQIMVPRQTNASGPAFRDAQKACEPILERARPDGAS
jgi:hypothetical protein